jgi:hypothetical protein
MCVARLEHYDDPLSAVTVIEAEQGADAGEDRAHARVEC